MHLYSSSELYESSPSISGLDGLLCICIVTTPPHLQFPCKHYSAMRVTIVTSLWMLLLFSHHPEGSDADAPHKMSNRAETTAHTWMQLLGKRIDCNSEKQLLQTIVDIWDWLSIVRPCWVGPVIHLPPWSSCKIAHPGSCLVCAMENMAYILEAALSKSNSIKRIVSRCLYWTPGFLRLHI